MARRLHGGAQSRRDRRSAAGPRRRRGAGPGVGSCGPENRVVQRGTCRAHGDRRHDRSRLGRGSLRRRLRAFSTQGARRRGRHRLHLGDDGPAQGCGGAPRQPLFDRPRPGAMVRPRLPDLLAVRHDQRLPARLRAHARRSERMVPAALRRGTLARPRRRRSPGGRLPGAGDGGAHRRRAGVRRDRPFQLGGRQRRQRADRAGDAAAVRRPSGRRSPLRVRNDRVRRRQRDADGRCRPTSRIGRPTTRRGRGTDRRRRRHRRAGGRGRPGRRGRIEGFTLLLGRPRRNGRPVA